MTRNVLLARRKSRHLYIIAEREALIARREFALIPWPQEGWEI